MLVSRIAWNSGVSGACWAGPDGWVWSHWVPMPRGRFHCPAQSGYLDSSKATAPATSISSIARDDAVIAQARFRADQRRLIWFSPLQHAAHKARCSLCRNNSRLFLEAREYTDCGPTRKCSQVFEGGKYGGGGRLSRACYAGGCQAAEANFSTKTPAPVAAGHSGGPHASRFALQRAFRYAPRGFWDRMGAHAYVRSMRAQVGLRRMAVRPWTPEWPKPARPVPEGMAFLGAVLGAVVLGAVVLGAVVLGPAVLGWEKSGRAAEGPPVSPWPRVATAPCQSNPSWCCPHPPIGADSRPRAASRW